MGIIRATLAKCWTKPQEWRQRQSGELALFLVMFSVLQIVRRRVCNFFAFLLSALLYLWDCLSRSQLVLERFYRLAGFTSSDVLS